MGKGSKYNPFRKLNNTFYYSNNQIYLFIYFKRVHQKYILKIHHCMLSISVDVFIRLSHVHSERTTAGQELHTPPTTQV